MELKKFLTTKKYNNKLASAMVLIFLKENIMLIVKNVWNKKQNGSKIFNKLKIIQMHFYKTPKITITNNKNKTN